MSTKIRTKPRATTGRGFTHAYARNRSLPGAIPQNNLNIVYPLSPGLPLLEGDIVEYKGDKYRVTSAHTSADHLPPDEAHALFEKL